MSFPVYLRIGSIAVHPHWVFESLAYVVGLYLYSEYRARYGDHVNASTRWRLIAVALAGGLIGSRVLAYFESPLALSPQRIDPIDFARGKTIVGGLVGGLLAVEWAKKRLGVTTPTGDVITLPLIAGIAIGRVGCFLSGLEDQSYGVATTLPWAVDFGDGTPRHPTQLYEILFLIVLAAVLVAMARRGQAVGDRFKLFLLAYLAFRLCVDFLKPGVRVGGLSVVQWVCVAVLAYYLPRAARLVRPAAERRPA